MKFEEFQDEILVLLGDSLVDVELTYKDVQLAFNKAKRTFQQIGPDNYRQGYFCINATRDDKIYMVPSEVTEVIRIINPSSMTWNAEDPLTLAAYNNLFTTGLSGNVSGMGDWLSLELLGQHMEIWNKYTANAIDFIHDKHTNSIRLLQSPKREGKYILEVYRHLSDEEYMDLLWVQSWAIAEAKRMLGMAYRKFSGLPSPDGGSVSLGGDQLVQEAKEEFRMLREDVDNQISGDVDWWGIYVG
jgi:hypothetical protein